MMQKYLIEMGIKTPIKVEVGYRNMRLSMAYILEDEGMTDKQYGFLWGWIPITEDELLSKTESPKLKITTIPLDLSFEVFWNAYNYKVGKKKRCINLWNAMGKDQRIKCLSKIPEYHYYLAHKPNIDQSYPETYLNNEMWENEYKVK